MERIEYSHFDKTTWGEGPWLTEPDKVQWQDAKTGLPCLIVRNPHGVWCGYVGVSKGHVAFEKGYDSVAVEVHGGLTFANKCHHDGLEDRRICHIVEKGEDDNVWWLGFDCGHWQDYMPAGTYRYGRERHEEYRDMKYVTSEVENLAKQLKGMTK